jgi:hypothetical protein
MCVRCRKMDRYSRASPRIALAAGQGTAPRQSGDEYENHRSPQGSQQFLAGTTWSICRDADINEKYHGALTGPRGRGSEGREYRDIMLGCSLSGDFQD